jgi:hypothetical protein
MRPTVSTVRSWADCFEARTAVGDPEQPSGQSQSGQSESNHSGIYLRSSVAHGNAISTDDARVLLGG